MCLQVGARAAWPRLAHHLVLQTPRQASVAQRCLIRRRVAQQAQASVFNRVACTWLRRVAFFCWRALAVASQLEREADGELQRVEAISRGLAASVQKTGACCCLILPAPLAW